MVIHRPVKPPLRWPPTLAALAIVVVLIRGILLFFMG